MLQIYIALFLKIKKITIATDLKRFISNCDRCDATRLSKKVNLQENAIIN